MCIDPLYMASISDNLQITALLLMLLGMMYTLVQALCSLSKDEITNKIFSIKQLLVAICIFTLGVIIATVIPSKEYFMYRYAIEQNIDLNDPAYQVLKDKVMQWIAK